MGAVDVTTERRGPLAVVTACALSVGLTGGLGLLPGLLAPALRADLGLERWQIGLLVSVHFGCAGLSAAPARRIVDRWGARVAVSSSLVLAAVAAGMAALGSYPILVAAVVLSGLGYALSGPGSSVAVERGVEARWRTAAMVAVRAGVPGTVAVLAIFGNLVADRLVWEWVPAGLAVGAAAAALYSVRVLQADRPEHKEDPGRRLPRHFVWFPVAAVLFTLALSPTLTWAVSYLQEGLGTSSVRSGTLVGMAAAVCFVVLNISCVLVNRIDAEARTRLVARFSSHNRLTWALFGFVHYKIRLAMSLCLVRATLAALMMSGVAFGVGVATLGLLGGMITQTACFGAMLAAVANRSPKAVSRATALTLGWGSLGTVLGPVAFGVLLDSGVTYGWGWFIVSMLLVGSAMSLRLAGWIAPPRRAKPQVTPSTA